MMQWISKAPEDSPDSETLPKSLKNKNGALPVSKSASTQQIQPQNEKRGNVNHETFSPFPRLHEIDRSVPPKHFLLLIAELPRRHSSLSFQLRSRHALLNKHLHRIAKVPRNAISERKPRITFS
jgi:hypothetical protein